MITRIEREERYISIGKKISQNTIAEARYTFTENYGGFYALEIRLSSKALNDMCAELGIKDIPVNFTNESVQGLLIKPDPTLNDDEWLVGYSHEKKWAVHKKKGVL